MNINNKLKMYFEDKEYKNFLEDIVLLTDNKELFRKKFLEVNEL